MGYQSNSFPVFLTVKTDGTLDATIRNFEQFAVGSMGKVARSATQAGQIASGAFSFADARRTLDSLASGITQLKNRMSAGQSDLFGIKNALSNLKNSPVDQELRRQAGLQRQYDSEREQARQQRIAGIQQEFNVAMSRIQARKAAELDALAEIMAAGDRRVALDRAISADQARAVAGREYIQAPGFNPQAANASAAAARAHANALNQLASAAEIVSLREGQATATDRAYAAQLRESAGAASSEAGRLEALALTQGRVAGAARGLNTANLELGSSQRNTRFATLQASQQFQDFFIQIQGGQNPLIAFSQQASQLAFVMSQTGGAAGKFASYLAGGWGTLIFAGISVLSIFTSKMFDSAKQTKKTEEAVDIHKKTITQLIKAIEAENEALGKSIQLGFEAEDAALKTAEKKLKEAESRRQNALSIIAELKAQQELNRERIKVAGNDPRISAPLLAENNAAGGRIALLENTVNSLKVGISNAQQEITRARVPILNRKVDEANDPSAKIRGDFERAEAAARVAFEKTTAGLSETGKDLAKRNAAEKIYSDTLDKATKAQAAATKALEERRQKTSLGDQAQTTNAKQLLNTALQYLGKREDRPADRASLTDFFKTAGVNVDPKMTAWCAAFVSAVLATNGLPIPKNPLAGNSFLGYGSPTKTPQPGDIVVFKPSAGYQHVGLFNQSLGGGKISVTGGNQTQPGTGGAVTTSTRSLADVAAFRRAPNASEIYKVEEAAAKSAESAALRAAQAIDELSRALTKPNGLIEAGNIDLFNRPQRQNADGSVSTVRSTSFGTDKGEVLVPTIDPNGKLLSDIEAIQRYQLTGEHLGIFKTAEDATHFAELLHKQQEALSNLANLSPEGREQIGTQALQEAEKLGQVADQTRERVAGITSQWNEQPKLIDQAAKATRDLADITATLGLKALDYDRLIGELKIAKPEGFEAQIALLETAKKALGDIASDAAKAGPIISEGMLRPFTEFVAESAKQAEIDTLRLTGREDEANAMQQILNLEKQMGPLSEGRKQAVLDTVKAERLMQRALEENEQLLQRAVQSANVFQDAITGIVAKPFDISSYKNAFSSIFGDFQKNFASSITSKFLGGDLGKQFEDVLRQKSDPLGASADQLTQSALELHKSAIALAQAGQTLAAGATGPTAGEIAATPSAYLPTAGGAAPIGGALSSIGSAIGGGAGSFLSLFGQIATQVGGASNTQTQILGAGLDTADYTKRVLDYQKRSALLADPVQYYNLLGKTVGGKLDQTLGSGGLFGSIGGKLGTVLQGVQLGQMAGALLSALGLKGKGVGIGSSIGGGIGALVGGPLGAIIGGLIGGLVGSLFGKKKKPKGFATIGGDEFGNLDVSKTGGKTAQKQESSKAANNVIDAIERIAEQFHLLIDASLGKVTVGIRGDDYRVDPTGGGRTKGPGVLNFGQDAQGAIEAAILDLINDGVLVGLREGTKTLLNNARNLQSGLSKALKFEDVFKKLKEYKDPLGAAIDELDFQFNDLRKIFAEAGASAAEYAQLEELYAIERADVIKKAAKDATATLKALFEELTYKGDFGLSLRTRETNAKAAFAPFQQQIQSGQPVDQEAFSDAARALLDVERSIYGSTQQYFEILALVTSLTQQAMNLVAQPVVVNIPGTTPITTTPGAPAPAPSTSPTPGYSTQLPGAGSPPATATPTPAQQAANDNYSMAQIIAVEIRKEAELLRQFLSPIVIINDIQTALRGVASLFGAAAVGSSNAGSAYGAAFGGGYNPFPNSPDETSTVNLAMQGTLDQLLQSSQTVAENTGQALKVGVGTDNGLAPAYSYNDPNNPQSYSALFPTFPMQRLTGSVSGFG